VSGVAPDPFQEWFGTLSFDDAVCWAFGVLEGDLDTIFWRYAFREIRQKIQLTLGEKASIVTANKAALVTVVNGLFGADTKGPPKVGEEGVRDMAAGASSPEQAAEQINAMLSRLGA
jgi:hypothetical protein